MAKNRSSKENGPGHLGFEATLWATADSFHRDLHKDLKADYILANPPFNMSDWGGDHLRDSICWKFGASPGGSAKSTTRSH